MKKERATTSDEQRERLLIAEQIERAKADTDDSPAASPPVEEGLKREQGAEKVVLSFSAKPLPSATSSAPAAAFKMNALKPKVNLLKAGANPLKRPNPLSTPIAGTKRGVDAVSFEDQESKRRRMDREPALV